jgi:hypothetical protein
MSRILTEATLRQAIGRWLNEGVRVAGPVRLRGIVQYAYLDSPESLVLSGFIRPANSIKQFLLPRHESLFSYQTKGRRVELAPAAAPAGPQVILAARPCDAAALPVLDHVFGWDVADGPYFQRRQSTTVITLACQEHDEHCFCTSVGMGPDNQRGSDAMLLRVDDEHLEVRICTDKGREIPGRMDDHIGTRGRTRSAAGAEFFDRCRPAFPGRGIRTSVLEDGRTPVPGMRGLRPQLPDLPLLRYCRRGGARLRAARTELGFPAS